MQVLTTLSQSHTATASVSVFLNRPNNMFFGDFHPTKKPLTFFTSLEEGLADQPGLSDSKKREYFYLNCQSDFDAKAWYENLAPSIITLWSTLVLHFHMKWLQASPDLLLKKPSVPLDAAMLIVAEPSIMRITNANTATILIYTTAPAHTITAALTIFETPAQPNSRHMKHHDY